MSDITPRQSVFHTSSDAEAGGVSSNAITRMLLASDEPSRPAKEWTAEHHRQWVGAVFERLMQESRASLDETLASRALCAWRITREMAYLRKIIDKHDTLSDVPFSFEPDWGNPWVVPTPLKLNRGAMKRPYYSEAAVRAMQAAEILPNGQGQTLFEGEPEVKGLALTPPGQISLPVQEGDPYHDPLLSKWIEVISGIGSALGLANGPHIDTFPPSTGYFPLLDPERARSHWPSIPQILLFEQILLEEVQSLVSANSYMVAKEEMRRKYGLTTFEFESIFAVVKARIRDFLDTDTEDHRAMLVMRIENFVDRAKDALDLSNEIKGLKALGVVLGVGKLEAKDSMKDFVQIVQQMSEAKRLERERNLSILDGPEQPQLTGRAREIVGEG